MIGSCRLRRLDTCCHGFFDARIWYQLDENMVAWNEHLSTKCLYKSTFNLIDLHIRRYHPSTRSRHMPYHSRRPTRQVITSLVSSTFGPCAASQPPAAAHSSSSPPPSLPPPLSSRQEPQSRVHPPRLQLLPQHSLNSACRCIMLRPLLVFPCL